MFRNTFVVYWLKIKQNYNKIKHKNIIYKSSKLNCKRGQQWEPGWNLYITIYIYIYKFPNLAKEEIEIFSMSNN